MAELFMRAFRFQVTLRKSPAAEAGEAGTQADPNRGAEPAAGGAALGNGAFQEVSGLEVTMDIADYLEGGRNDGLIRRAGRARYVPIVLKRGMFYAADSDGNASQLNKELWQWLQSVVSGQRPIPRYDGLIEVMGKHNDDIVATWAFTRGLPARIKGPELNGKTGEIAIEELQIAHEGLQLL
ncbi:phage tail protein [Chitinivorax sp. B]|uniref:phage tail protein n=1 Tax=Chitinivorax sp. B TaxID=2502235 RepID=UPI0010F48FAD|nr:phage tail protein [Chitinivorax sp. B]